MDNLDLRVVMMSSWSGGGSAMLLPSLASPSQSSRCTMCGSRAQHGQYCNVCHGALNQSSRLPRTRAGEISVVDERMTSDEEDRPRMAWDED